MPASSDLQADSQSPHVGLALCRDCLAETRAGTRHRCAACGSPRLLQHPEQHQLSLAHIDCDAFYASVEKRDDPSLADKPVIIGGGKRGVVATACYVARTYGVRSAMPMFQALKACPQAVVIKPNMAKYVEVGRAVRQMMRDLTPLVEPISIDEAFLDLSGTERLHRGTPVLTLLRLARTVQEQIGITISVGLSYNKFLAKVASDLDKPRGFAIIGRKEALAFLGPRPVGMIPGVGKAAEKRLAERGLRTIGDLRNASPAQMLAAFGKDGGRLVRLAHGIDDRRVVPERETKSISSETTFEQDVRDRERLEAVLWSLCEKVSARMKAADLAGTSITLKLKTADFRLRSRSRSGIAPTQLARSLFEIGRELLAGECDGTAFRLIGIGASELGPDDDADKGDLADTRTRRDADTERAIDHLRARFGTDAVVRGITLKHRSTLRTTSKQQRPQTYEEVGESFDED